MSAVVDASLPRNIERPGSGSSKRIRGITMTVDFHDIVAFLRQRSTRLRHFVHSEAALLAVALVVLVCSYCYVKLADEVQEGGTQTVDEWVLVSLRRTDDRAIPIGPAWLREIALDITALGSFAVLVLLTAAVIGLMILQRQYGILFLTAFATATGGAASVVLKELLGRDRPTVVPHLREVSSPSFPSGHAMLSAIVFLTLGILLMQTVHGRAAKWYCLLWAIVLTILVGLSRIYLGVHYPTDVLAGWMAGTAWALACWVAAQYASRWRSRFTPARIEDGAGKSTAGR
jgi:undecaprenyl-diphosphatase